MLTVSFPALGLSFVCTGSRPVLSTLGLDRFWMTQLVDSADFQPLGVWVGTQNITVVYWQCDTICGPKSLLLRVGGQLLSP